MRLSHQPRRVVVRAKGRRPVSFFSKRLTPRQTRLRPLRLPRNALEALNALHAEDRLAKPPLGRGVPVVLCWPHSLQALHPPRNEWPEIWQCTSGHAFHVSDRIRQRDDALNIGDGRVHSVGATTERGGRVHARHILRHRDVHIDVQHFLDHLVLTEADVASRDGEKQRLEHGSSARMIAG